MASFFTHAGDADALPAPIISSRRATEDFACRRRACHYGDIFHLFGEPHGLHAALHI